MPPDIRRICIFRVDRPCRSSAARGLSVALAELVELAGSSGDTLANDLAGQREILAVVREVAETADPMDVSARNGAGFSMPEGVRICHSTSGWRRTRLPGAPDD